MTCRWAKVGSRAGFLPAVSFHDIGGVLAESFLSIVAGGSDVDMDFVQTLNLIHHDALSASVIASTARGFSSPGTSCLC